MVIDFHTPGASVPVTVMVVGNVPVGMTDRLVPVWMTVRAGRHRVMNVAVMAVAMPVGVLVLHWLVRVFVLVRLCQMQHRRGDHQGDGGEQPWAAAPLAQRERDQRADERRERDTASRVSISDALIPLVLCSPHASAAGAMAAPNKAISNRRGASVRRTRASLPMG